MASTNSSFDPLLELATGAAYKPHPGDAALSVSRRFQHKSIVIIGGGGTTTGWTQRVCFDKQGLAALEGRRSGVFKRATAEWGTHLLQEAAETSGWAVLLMEQQWQAAISSTSATSLGAGGVERMLRVRDAVSRFGDDRMAEDAVRAAVDHPTMEGSIVAGARLVAVESLQKEAEANGFNVACVRIPTLALVERYLARLQARQTSPARTIVAYDGHSALIVGVREGAFDTSEGGLSYLVNRPATEVRAQVARRLSSPVNLKEWSGKVDLIGAPFTFENGQLPEGIDMRQEQEDVVLSVVDDAVRHDLRADLQEMRPALPSWVHGCLVFAAVLIVAGVVGTIIHVSEGSRLSALIREQEAEGETHTRALAAARNGLANLQADEVRARGIGAWVDKNFHAQELTHAFLLAVPLEASLDAVSIMAVEGLPQARLKFTLLGTEDSQRHALRMIEARLYQLGYEVGKREDPTLSTSRRGAVVYAWDLILPSFGSRHS